MADEKIKRRLAKGDKRLRVLVLTSNELKKREYAELLGDRYGINLSFAPPPTGQGVTEPYVLELFREAAPSPHYVLREESSLVNACDRRELNARTIVDHPDSAPPLVLNVSLLRLWKPRWNAENCFVDFAAYEYSHSVKGYIDPQYADLRNPAVFGWDHLFVNPCTGHSCLQSAGTRWGKTAARQQVLADFITNHLFYKSPLDLKHHPELAPVRSVEFTSDLSVSKFMASEPHLSNPNIDIWGLGELRTRILNEGVFFKAGTSRPVKNYFSPPFGGIPLTTKKTAVEETVFMMHDLNHHNVPDLIFDGDSSREARNVYVAWRMMSEAITMIIADMFYADTVVRTWPEMASACDSRIFPLWQMLRIPPPSPKTNDNTLREVLWANTQYAVLGDDAAFQKILQEGEEAKARFASFKSHFEKFFVGDHVWTAKNFDNLVSNSEQCCDWIEWLGRDMFHDSHLYFVGDIVERLRNAGADLSTLASAVPPVFDEIMRERIIPRPTAKVTEEERTSRAFRRYMMGQLSFYAVFKALAGMETRARALAERIRSSKTYSPEYEELRNSIRRQYERDVRYVWGMGVITSSACANHMEVHPVFPPVYISYGRQKCKTIKEVVAELYSC